MPLTWRRATCSDTCRRAVSRSKARDKASAPSLTAPAPEPPREPTKTAPAKTAPAKAKVKAAPAKVKPKAESSNVVPLRAGNAPAVAPAAVLDAPPARPSPSPELGGMAQATQAKLQAAQRLHTPDGEAAMAVARRFDRLTPLDTGNSVAALRRAHADALDRALAGWTEADPADLVQNLGGAVDLVLLAIRCAAGEAVEPMQLAAESFKAGRASA